jgi:hypothetical protein
MISKCDESVKTKIVNRDRNNYTRLKVKTKTGTEKAKNEHLDRIWDQKTELQRTAHEDKGIRLESESHNSNHWHQRLSREYNGRSETSTETLRELYYRALRSNYQGIKEMRDKKTTRVYDVSGEELRFLGDGLRLRAQLNKINETAQWSMYFTEVIMPALLLLKQTVLSGI